MEVLFELSVLVCDLIVTNILPSIPSNNYDHKPKHFCVVWSVRALFQFLAKAFLMKCELLNSNIIFSKVLCEQKVADLPIFLYS